MRSSHDEGSRTIANGGAERTSRTGLRLRWAAMGLVCLAGAGGATDPQATTSAANPNPNDAVAQRLAEVTAIAGAPVNSFRYMNPAQFEPIGLSHMLVYTTPQEVWLLRLNGTCRDLDFGPFLKLTSHMHRVSTLTDSVIVRNNPIPCMIEEIRPVNASLLKHGDNVVNGEVDTSVESH
jgi:Family of unknown function (DUF6491)